MATNGSKNDEKSGGKRRLALVIIAVVLAAVAGGGWFFFLKPAPPTEPVLGEIMTIEPVQMNLAAGHYIRVGLALQLVEGAEVDGSKALDAAITTFSGLPISDVSSAEQREELRVQLAKKLELTYEGDVLAVYFTEFVTQ